MRFWWNDAVGFIQWFGERDTRDEWKTGKQPTANAQHSMTGVAGLAKAVSPLRFATAVQNCARRADGAGLGGRVEMFRFICPLWQRGWTLAVQAGVLINTDGEGD